MDTTLVKRLDTMVYNPFLLNIFNDDGDPNAIDMNSIEIEIPLSSYVYDIDTVLSNNDCIKLRSYNIRSIPLHLYQFLDCQNTSFDILCLCETRMTDDLANLFPIDAYQWFHQSRIRLGGGVSAYVRSALSPVHVPQLSFTHASLEAVAVQFSAQKGKRDIVISVYRTPSGNVAEFIVKMEEIIKYCRDQNYHDIYIAGDINIDLLKTGDPDATQLMNLMHSYNLYCIINKPTRVTETSATLIDHIWVSNCEKVNSTYIVIDDQTDHFPVEGHIQCTQKIKLPIQYRNKRLFNENSKIAFQSELSDVSWTNVYQSADANEAYTIFIDKFKSLFEKHFPVKRIRMTTKTRDEAYLTPAMKDSLREKRRLHRLAKKYPLTYYDTYLRHRDTCNNAIKVAREQYYQEKMQASASNTRSLWREINKVMGRGIRTTEPLIKLPEGSNQTHSNFINSHFDNSIKSLKQAQTRTEPNGFRKYLSPPCDFSLRLAPVSEDEIHKFIQDNKSSAAGYDDLEPQIIKQSSNIIKKPLAHIVNTCFKTGTFPEELKVAKIIPLHKKRGQN